jgi:hypothetical protein
VRARQAVGILFSGPGMKISACRTPEQPGFPQLSRCVVSTSIAHFGSLSVVTATRVGEFLLCRGSRAAPPSGLIVLALQRICLRFWREAKGVVREAGPGCAYKSYQFPIVPALSSRNKHIKYARNPYSYVHLLALWFTGQTGLGMD